MKSYEQLDAWKRAMDLIQEVYSVTREFPSDERFGLTSQIRKAANSIAANIAEGFGRYTYKDKANKYVIARGECTEVEAFLFIAVRLKFCEQNDIQLARLLVQQTGQILSGLIRSTRNSQSNFCCPE